MINHEQPFNFPSKACGRSIWLATKTLLLAVFMAAVFMAAIANFMAGFANAQQPTLPSSGGYHPLFRADMPAGVVGQGRLIQPGPVAGYYQPVVFDGPVGTRFALPEGEMISAGEENLMAGLLIGKVYRFRITQIPQAEGAELYPTVELIDRIYPPANLATSYPIPITIDEDDLNEALAGKMVTRVVYLEDPQTAIALPQEPQTSGVLDVGEKDDALRIADKFGRPVAIVRIGTVAPPTQQMLLPQFYFGYPSWAPIYQSEQ